MDLAHSCIFLESIVAQSIYSYIMLFCVRFLSSLFIFVYCIFIKNVGMFNPMQPGRWVFWPITQRKSKIIQPNLMIFPENT